MRKGEENTNKTLREKNVKTCNHEGEFYNKILLFDTSFQELKIKRKIFLVLTGATVCWFAQVIELHRSGVSLSVGDHRGWRPLHYAARHGHKEVVRYIISNGETAPAFIVWDVGYNRGVLT